jgi:DNA repair photolyase
MTTGTKEWAKQNINICVGCENGCRYCYAQRIAQHYRNINQEVWRKMIIDEKKVNKNYQKRDGTIMFPSTHDIVATNLDAYCIVLEKLLKAGNDVLIVSKPRINCFERICEQFSEYKKQITFRFTITSSNEDHLRYWEPFAPDYEERITSLEYAYKKGFETSVSIEPFLDDVDELPKLVQFLENYTNGDIWIGKMSNIPTDINQDERKRLLKNYNEESLKRLAFLLFEYKQVRFKDSIGQILHVERPYKFVDVNQKIKDIRNWMI